MNDANNAGALVARLEQVAKVMRSARAKNIPMEVWADDLKTIEDAILAVRLDEAAIRKDGIYLVWSNEHSAWWGPNRAGYNTHISHAGRYTREEAIAICVRARGGREFNSNPSEVPIPLKDAEAFWTEDGLEERYRRESRERKEEYEREEIEAASAIRNGGKQP